MASITKRGSKYAVVYTYTNEHGEKKQKWETCETQREAKKRKAEIEFQQSNDTFIPPTVKTVSDLLYEFVEIYGVNKWALSTYTSKKGLIDNYVIPFIGNWNLADATPRTMDEYYKKLLSVKTKPGFRKPDTVSTLSARNIREVHKVLRCAFNQAVKWEYIARNPVEHASLPKSEPKEREIWTAETLFHALEQCEDERLSLAINLAFSCSLRIGELTGLTWDCVDISEESLMNNNASIYIAKELSRVSRSAMNKLNNRDVLFVFPAVLSSTSTALVLKKPKTKSSVRRIWLPPTVAKMLVRARQVQEDWKDILGKEYQDYNLVFTLSNGRPCEERVIVKSFKKLIDDNDLPKVVFHSLRHTSTTYKLKLTGGDMKAVQGDTGHAQLKMVSDVYSHIIDEDRRQNAMRFEQAFYQKPLQKEAEAAPDTTVIIQMLQQSPEFANQLLQALGSLAASPISKPPVPSGTKNGQLAKGPF